MSESFGDAWRKVRLHTPDTPFGLAREWTQHAYEDLCRRRPWGFLRKNGQLLIPAQRTLLGASFTVGSTTVVDSLAEFLPTDVGATLQVGNLPVYTILTVSPDKTTVTLDQPWSGFTISVAQSQGPVSGIIVCQVGGTYQTLPADFGAFELIVDMVMQRIIPWWFTQEDLARVDPMRFSSGDLQRALVSKDLSPVPSTLGQVRYEWWPAPTVAKAFPYYYRQQAQVLSDTAPLLGGLTARVLSLGALAHGAQWPGTVEQKNPYLNLALHKQLADQFDHECAILELRDDDQYQQSWVALPYHRWSVMDLGFGDTHTLRSTDATVNSYF